MHVVISRGKYIISLTHACIQGYAFLLITVSRHMRLKCARYSYVYLKCVCIHACCVLQLHAHGLSCPKGTYITIHARICVSLHNHVLYESEVCAFCVFSCHVQREHITDYIMCASIGICISPHIHVLYEAYAA